MSVDAIRKRPGMYIGDTADGSGLHNMIYEVIDNSINETLAGRCDRIDIVLNADGSATVTDNGRGIPFDIHPETGLSAAEMILTQLYAGGKYFHDSAREKRRHGVGLAVVNALSETLCLRVWRDGLERAMHFRVGVPEIHATPVRAAEVKDGKAKRGTEIAFLPDPTIFAATAFDFSVIENRLRKLSERKFGATIALIDRRNGRETDITFGV